MLSYVIHMLSICYPTSSEVPKIVIDLRSTTFITKYITRLRQPKGEYRTEIKLQQESRV